MIVPSFVCLTIGGTANGAPIFYGGIPASVAPKGTRVMSAKKINIEDKCHPITPNFRQVDVFAAYTAYSDNEIGRVIQAVEDMGKLDNTLIIYINGDNGTSAEGTMLGTPNQLVLRERINSGDVLGPSMWVGAPSINGSTAPTADSAAKLSRGTRLTIFSGQVALHSPHCTQASS